MNYSLESDFIQQLDEDILGYIRRGLNNDDEEGFNHIALREFELQYHTIKPYREYCSKKGISPGQITLWKDIPAVPSLAFKKFVMASFSVEKAEHAYFTSGTTDPERKGKIFRDKGAVRLINAANALLIGEALIYAAAYPRTEARLEALGIAVQAVDVSELAKAEGAVTCCSLILRE